MAIAFVGAADGGNNGGGVGHTFAYTVGTGANRLLVVGFAGADSTVGGADISSVTFGGDALTLIGKNEVPNSADRYAYFYYLLNPQSGTHNVVISCGFAHYVLAGAMDYSGVKQSGQPESSATHAEVDSSHTVTTTTLVTVADGCWTILLEEGYGVPVAVVSGAVLRTQDAAYDTWNLMDSGGAISPAGSHSMATERTPAVTFPAFHVMAAFAPAAAAGSSIGTISGLANASVATVEGLPRASMATWVGLA